jgi:predicted negative regulator of RcsB-dependent stress response
MKKKTSSLIYLIAGIGVAALLYYGWTIYQRHTADDAARASFSATPIPGSPNFLDATPQPPPQP